jgi:hypothetical protein
MCALEEPAASVFNVDSTFLTGYIALLCHGDSSSEFPSLHAGKEAVIMLLHTLNSIVFLHVLVFCQT